MRTKEQERKYYEVKYLRHKAAINLRNKIAKYRDRYGISYEEALKLKANGCEVCGEIKGKLCIDHDHDTGKIRGCLCTNCNSSLGKLKEDVDLIEKLKQYLLKHKVN
jgi:hypothetical protein